MSAREVTTIEAAALIVIAIAFTAFAIRLLNNDPPQVPEAPTSRMSQDWRPPIDRCPQTMPLWDCIRHAKYRSQ